MRRALLISVRMAIATIVLVGIVYPLVVWGIAAVAFPRQANGSLVTSSDGTVLGSKLIAQNFTADKYFHPRPSAAGAGFDAMASAPSNLGPTNRTLISAVATRVAEVVRIDGAERGKVPVDLVTSSASGLDPDISPASAYLQCARIARARGLSEAAVRALVARSIHGRQLGLLGEPRVNVLELNLALDRLKN